MIIDYTKCVTKSYRKLAGKRYTLYSYGYQYEIGIRTSRPN